MHKSVASLILAAVVVTAVLGCHDSETRESRLRSRFASWLAETPLVRRGGNGKIDSEILAVAVLSVPVAEGEGRWSDREWLAVWSRFENLDSSWTWDPARQPVFVTVEDRDGRHYASPGEDVLRSIRRDVMGHVDPSGPLVVGDRFVTVSLFEPPRPDKALVVRTNSKLENGDVIELVAALVAPERVRRPQRDLFTRDE